MELKLLLQEKNNFYLDILSKILDSNKLDSIISLEERNDLSFIIKT
jgi:hypothetical protein